MFNVLPLLLAFLALLLLLDIFLFRTDSSLQGSRDKKANAISNHQRRKSHLVVQKCGHRNHKSRHGFQHAGDGIRLGVIALRDQQRVKAIVSHHVDAIDASNDKGKYGK